MEAMFARRRNGVIARSFRSIDRKFLKSFALQHGVGLPAQRALFPPGKSRYRKAPRIAAPQHATPLQDARMATNAAAQSPSGCCASISSAPASPPRERAMPSGSLMPPAFVKDPVIGNPNEYRPAIPLDDLLRRVRLSGVIQTSIQLTAPWGCDLPQNADEVLLYLVLVGECVAYTEKKPDPIRLGGGDALLVPAPHQHAMADSLTTPLEPLDRFVPAHMRTADSADEFLAKTFRSAVQYGGGGEMTLIVTMRLYLDPGIPNVVLRNLPTLIPLRGFISSNQAFLKHMLFQISAHGSGGFTGQAIATRLAECVLISALRSYMEQMSKGRSKLYHGWNDPFLSKVVGAIYDAPDFNWSISNMASKAGLSRSAFIHRFSDVIGQTPGEFILSIRMARAMELLEKTDVSIAQIATRVGYASEASFSRAFLRWAGVTPGLARRRKPMDSVGARHDDAPGTKQATSRKHEDAH